MLEPKTCACGCGEPVARSFVRGHNRIGHYVSIDARLNARIDRSGGPDACWPWRGQVTDRGYGRVVSRGRVMMAHRLVYERARGPVPPDAWVWHRCKNPSCCNPAHLEAGAPGDVLLGDRTRGEAHHRTRLTEASVREIRSRYTAGDHPRTLAGAFGISRASIFDIVHRRRWRHVD